jgi:hypothetical protein
MRVLDGFEGSLVVQDCVDDATPKVEVGSPQGESAVRVRHRNDDN